MEENIVKLAEHNEQSQSIDVATIQRLARLSEFEYDRVRENEAKRLNARVGTLDKAVKNARKVLNEEHGIAGMFSEVEPWEDPVSGCELLDDIYKAIKTYIVCQEETALAATLWVTFTWFIDHVQVAPLAIITAPERGCGKTQMLEVMGMMSKRPLSVSHISPSAIFRVIEAHCPTLLIDEADTFLRDNEDARGILNSGHTRRMAYVIRNVGDDHEPKQFRTWGAKAISGISASNLHETLTSRAVMMELRRKLATEKVERLRYADKQAFMALTSKLARFANDAGSSIACARPALPPELGDRAQDNWEPLLAIADHAGGSWPEKAREAAIKLSREDKDTLSLSAELLADIHEIFTNERISLSELLEKLNADELKPWATYNRGKPMTPRQLSKRLAEYGIKAEVMRVNSKSTRGYKREWFEDAFSRYLSPAGPEKKAVIPLQNGFYSMPSEACHVTDEKGVTVTNSPSVTQDAHVTDGENVTVTENPPVTSNPLKINGCYDVTEGEVF